jgi:AraC family transcriptional regulator
MKPSYRVEDVSIVAFPETRIAVLEHRGDPKRKGDSIRTFIQWRKETGHGPEVSATYNLFYGSPSEGPPEAFRIDICASTTRGVEPNAHGVVERLIPAGRCAKLRHVGSDDTLGEALHFLYAEWLPGSGEEVRDFPLFVQRLRFFPDVPGHEAVTDVFLPVG